MVVAFHGTDGTEWSGGLGMAGAMGDPVGRSELGTQPGGDPAADPDELARLGLDLRLACQRIARRVRYEAAPFSVAPHQLAVLARLVDGPLPPGEIAERESVSAPSMTRTVNGLVDAGYLERHKHPTDGRVVLIGLSETGRALIEEARHRQDLWVTSRLRQLAQDDVAAIPQVVRILSRVAAL